MFLLIIRCCRGNLKIEFNSQLETFQPIRICSIPISKIVIFDFFTVGM